MHGAAAADHFGRVVFNAVPVPGATVVATHLDQQVTTTTDLDGVFRLTALADGQWTVRVEMMGFVAATQEIRVAAETPPSTWELKLLPLAEMVRGAQAARAESPPALEAPGANAADRAATGGAGRPTGAGAGASPAPDAGFQRAQVNPSSAGAALVNDPTAAGDLDRGSADGFLINGSVNNGAASPFAQLAAFGNNRRNARSLYNGGVGLLLGNSSLDARPFSFTDQQAAKPSYSDAQIVASFAGPLIIPHLSRGTRRTCFSATSARSITTPARSRRCCQRRPSGRAIFPGAAMHSAGRFN